MRGGAIFNPSLSRLRSSILARGSQFPTPPNARNTGRFVEGGMGSAGPERSHARNTNRNRNEDREALDSGPRAAQGEPLRVALGAGPSTPWTAKDTDRVLQLAARRAR